MSNGLVMEVSKEIFKLNKEVLIFKINPSTISKLSLQSSIQSSDLKPLSEEDIVVTNLTSEFLAFRAKTTKKDNYTVNPAYCIILPNESKVLNITFYNKVDEKLDSKGHKFKFEGFVIPESRKNEEAKNLFQEYIQERIEVRGNTEKRNVQFLDETNHDGKLLQGINNMLVQSSESGLNNYTVAEDKKNNEGEKMMLSDIIGDKVGKIGSDNNKEKLEMLKNEYNILKEQIDNLKRNEELLNKRIINEKNKKSPSLGSNKFNYKVPHAKEEKISMNIFLTIFVISLIIGFYLVK